MNGKQLLIFQGSVVSPYSAFSRP